MKKLACMAMAALVIMAVMTPSATAGVGGASPDRFGGNATKTTLQTETTIGGVAARSNRIPGVGGAEPEGVGGARPTGVGGARPLAFDAASGLRQLPAWVIEILLRSAWGR